MATVDSEQITFTTYGVPMEVVVPAWLQARALALVPPGAQNGLTVVGDVCRATLEPQNDRLRINVQGVTVGVTQDEDLALAMLGKQIHAQVAMRAPQHIFVRAGVVAVRGRAAVFPGWSFVGKTTLTRALVAAGAAYYSDEFAVLDGDGLVHPYPAAASGAETGGDPVPVALVAVTSYRPRATLSRKPLAPGAAMLALLNHTVPAQTRPRQAIPVLKAALRRATAWTSERGEATDTAGVIMDSLA